MLQLGWGGIKVLRYTKVLKNTDSINLNTVNYTDTDRALDCDLFLGVSQLNFYLVALM